MCGIFAIYYFDKTRQVNKQMVVDATNTMIHRGPDDSGFFVRENIGLGHRRLSIIDLSFGHQPMTNEDGNIVVVYNGEIYNYPEIRQDLITKGHIFRTNCDTEVIVHAYEEWGLDCLERFNGMFAFAIWDNREKKLWVVRDRIGIKPLYYYVDKDVFICASEIKAILKTGLVQSGLNENVLDAYFSVGYVPGPETMFENIRKLLPGHWMVVRAEGGVVGREYWDLDVSGPRNIDFKTALNETRDLLADAVQKRLVSDVPLGAFLSGGLDSSVVVALMSEIIDEPVNTFLAAYHDDVSEHKYARMVADSFKTNHYEFYLEPNDFFSSIRKLIEFAEEPIVEPAAIPLYHIAKLAREHVTVLLSGEGSDEIFAGYALYRYMQRIDKIRTFLPSPLSSLLGFVCGYIPRLKQRKYFDWLTLPLSKRYQGISSYLTDSQKKLLYTPEFYHEKSEYLESVFEGYFRRAEKAHPLSQMLYVDIKTWLVDDLLVKADKMTMAASVELRVPFLDHRLVSLAMILPARYKINGKQGKYILKKIAESTLPCEIVYRKKMGFPVPTRTWFGGRLNKRIQEILLELKKTMHLDVSVLDNLMFKHKAGVEDHSKILLTALVFIEWGKHYL